MAESPQARPRLIDVDPAVDLLARLRLDHPARRHGVLIVEGPTDRRVLATVLGVDMRQIFQVKGRINVLRCVRLLAGQPMPGVVCIADRDFDESEGNWTGSAWIVFFDGADLEAMMVASPALERFLEEWAAPGKLADFGGPDAVRSHLAGALRPLSALRAENARSHLGLPFDSLVIADILDKSGAVRGVGLAGRLRARSSVPQHEIMAAMEGDVPSCPHTGLPLVRGRDAMALIGVLLRKRIGSMSMQQTEDDFVERSMRLAIAVGDFSTSGFAGRLERAMASVAVGSA